MLCEVRGCEQRSKKIDTSNLTIHRFPLEVKEAGEWARFSGSAYAQEQFKLSGPVGVRKLFMCSQHFEPDCYKAPGSRMGQTPVGLRYGAIPTLNGPSDELPDEVGGDGEEGNQNAPMEDEGDAADEKSARKRKHGHLDDSFYDFLKDNDDDDSDNQPTIAENTLAVATSSKSGHASRVRKPHPPFCVCSVCRANRAAKAMEKGICQHKSIQTGDSGPQPDASPVPMGANQDSCRLCFSTDLLEPLCSGMIVVRDEMLDKIYVCTGILVIPRPKVSIFICTPCAQLINSFHAYRQQVCSNNRALLHTMALKQMKLPPSAPKIQKVAPFQSPSVRKLAGKPSAPPVPMKRKPPVGLIPVMEASPMRVPQGTPIQYRKIVPKIAMVVQPAVTAVNPPIKEEQDDPLEGCDETLKKPIPMVPIARASNYKIKIPKPMVEVKEEPEAQLHMDAEEGQEGLPEGERWHCANSFPFQFECAKHLLKVHEESVEAITDRLKLDELNANMLQMMSVTQKK